MEWCLYLLGKGVGGLRKNGWETGGKGGKEGATNCFLSPVVDIWLFNVELCPERKDGDRNRRMCQKRNYSVYLTLYSHHSLNGSTLRWQMCKPFYCFCNHWGAKRLSMSTDKPKLWKRMETRIGIEPFLVLSQRSAWPLRQTGLSVPLVTPPPPPTLFWLSITAERRVEHIISSRS